MNDRPDLPEPASPNLPDLPALIVARLCHDLASPLGAISNGVELLEMVTPQGPEVALVAQSARQATARLRLFRLAFGQERADQMASASEIASILRAHAETARCRVEYLVPTDIARADAKMVALAMMCLETAFPWGGTIRIERVGDMYRLAAEGPRLMWDAGIWAILGTPGDGQAVTPATVHFAALQASAAQHGVQIAVTPQDATLSVVLRPRMAGGTSAPPSRS